jgi:hypothetical protein
MVILLLFRLIDEHIFATRRVTPHHLVRVIDAVFLGGPTGRALAWVVGEGQDNGPTTLSRLPGCTWERRKGDKTLADESSTLCDDVSHPRNGSSAPYRQAIDRST